MNYENTNNFKNSIFSAGTNPNNSVDGYFYANGIPLNTLETSSYGSLNSGAQQAFLAYNACY
jgi:hypothetical protein